MFPTRIIVSPFAHIFEFISLFAAELEDPKTGLSGKGSMATVHKSMFPGLPLTCTLPLHYPDTGEPVECYPIILSTSGGQLVEPALPCALTYMRETYCTSGTSTH